jgi:hypothetical protein
MHAAHAENSTLAMTAWLKRFLPMCRNIKNRGADLMAEELSKRGRIPALPTFRSGGTLVDIADRDALYQAMEGR